MNRRYIAVISLLVFVFSSVAFATPTIDREAIRKTAMNYIEGFYEGDAGKLKSVLKPDLRKFGFWKGEKSPEYRSAGQMTYAEALKFAEDVKNGKRDAAKPDAPKLVEILDSTDKIAIVKVAAYWGVDYMLLAKNDDKWMVSQILWEGPSITAEPTDADKAGVERAGLNYVEGFYEGDASKLEAAFDPKMYKFGYGFDRKKGDYYDGGQMTYEKALAYANNVKAEKKFPKPGTVREVEVLGVMNKIGAIKITAWWGVDYMLVSKRDDGWKIEQVLWASLAKAG